MKIDEELSDDGRTISLELCERSEHFELRANKNPIGIFSSAIVLSVVRRYARTLDIEYRPEAGSLRLGEGLWLRSWFYRAPVDLESKHYLVLEADRCVSTAVLSKQISNALRHLANAQRIRSERYYV